MTFAPPASSRQSGMTLVEVLLVVFIMALVAGFAVMTLPARDSSGDRAVRKVRMMVQTLSDRSLLTGEVVALQAGERGLEALQWTGETWQPMALAPLSLPDGMHVEIRSAEAGPRRLREKQAMLVINPLGEMRAARFEIIGDEATRTLSLTPDGKVVETDAG
ncbi:prepilin-type N-terminal cleavage/methylation domain-containing protein [Henriciella aquimarina]|uniref:prepilin-type N-terminal cleavage/methylation domain-containing protein n=1 Tax=Henriciella aquimarina TaxID=545261 RepID=UPI00117A192D|nr:prepilin-type N-terminal cleavage/methylation domain-containing protein [Henriciella aquimarina]